jgi:hypothetical protein
MEKQKEQLLLLPQLSLLPLRKVAISRSDPN